MKINTNKTKILPFNLSTKFDFLPQLNFPEQPPLEVIYETRLLGVTLASNLSWWPHINDITRRATKKLWVLVRFKSLGGSKDQLVQIYLTRVRSTLEFAAPVFHPGMTHEQSMQVERVQKKDFAIILGNRYLNYESALSELNLERLDERRLTLSYNFAVKRTKSTRHSYILPTNPNYRPHRRSSKLYLEALCNTARHFNSSVPFISRLLKKVPRCKS